MVGGQGSGDGQGRTAAPASGWLWLGIGCGSLLTLTLVLAGAGYYLLRTKQQDVKALSLAAKALKTSSSAAPAPPKQTRAAVEASPVCARTIRCCRAVAKKGGADEAVQQACDRFASATDDKCSQAHETYKATAAVVKVSCD